MLPSGGVVSGVELFVELGNRGEEVWVVLGIGVIFGFVCFQHWSLWRFMRTFIGWIRCLGTTGSIL